MPEPPQPYRRGPRPVAERAESVALILCVGTYFLLVGADLWALLA